MIADDFTLARVIHVVAVLFWIGGVAFVTLVLMPAVRAGNPPAERLAAFHRIEGRFAPQARLWVLLAGASGLVCLEKIGPILERAREGIRIGEIYGTSAIYAGADHREAA